MAKKILLEAWAAKHYDPPPSEWTLAQWRRAGQIHPAPERVDRKWYVYEDAERVTFENPRPALLRQLKGAA